MADELKLYERASLTASTYIDFACTEGRDDH